MLGKHVPKVVSAVQLLQLLYLAASCGHPAAGHFRQVPLASCRFWRDNNLLKILTAVICFLLALIMIVMICMYSNEIKLHSIFINHAASYLHENMYVFIYVPIFLLFAVGLTALCVWQHCCFSSSLGTSKNIYNPNNSGVWGVLNIL